MAAYYSIFGKQVASHYLVFATWASIYLGVKAATGGSSASGAAKAPEPKITASSSEEESFIHEFLKAAESETPAAKH